MLGLSLLFFSVSLSVTSESVLQCCSFMFAFPGRFSFPLIFFFFFTCTILAYFSYSLWTPALILLSYPTFYVLYLCSFPNLYIIFFPPSLLIFLVSVLIYISLWIFVIMVGDFTRPGHRYFPLFFWSTRRQGFIYPNWHWLFIIYFLYHFLSLEFILVWQVLFLAGPFFLPPELDACISICLVSEPWQTSKTTHPLSVCSPLVHKCLIQSLSPCQSNFLGGKFGTSFPGGCRIGSKRKKMTR